ncbi:MAG: hypothetical protein J6C91_09315, partial [Muribaculaceae bacterium]|nr:hypothetical protein [Muribaculaceae bacterium]
YPLAPGAAAVRRAVGRRLACGLCIMRLDHHNYSYNAHPYFLFFLSQKTSRNESNPILLLHSR